MLVYNVYCFWSCVCMRYMIDHCQCVNAKYVQLIVIHCACNIVAWLISSQWRADKENFKSRKHFRNPKNHKNSLNIEQREKGLAYTIRKGKEIPAKKFTKIICKCRKSCHLTTTKTDLRWILPIGSLECFCILFFYYSFNF